MQMAFFIFAPQPGWAGCGASICRGVKHRFMQAQDSREFYLVSMGKFTLLYFATMGMYSLIWFYLHWEAQNRRPNAKPVWPAPRALFAVFFIDNLCARLANLQRETGNTYPWNPKALALGFIVLQLVHLSISIAIKEGYLSSVWAYSVPFLMVAEYYFLYKFQLVANRTLGDPFGKANSQFTPVNALFIGFGVVMWLGWLQSLMAPAAAP
jgi:hypothetical protein